MGMRVVREKGFTLVEMAVALVVIGLLTWAVSSAYQNMQPMADRNKAVQLGEQARDSLRSFALMHKRLPCPDLNGNGREGDASGGCPEGRDSGLLPYYSLGISVPDEPYRAVYAVYRNGDAGGVDLTVLDERTGDSQGDDGYKNIGDLLYALNSIDPNENNTDLVRVTGDGNAASEGAIDCSNNIRLHPAFFLVLPLDDVSGNGSRFDSVHDHNSNCAYSAITPRTVAHDDLVVVESSAMLSGWLAARR